MSPLDGLTPEQQAYIDQLVKGAAKIAAESAIAAVLAAQKPAPTAPQKPSPTLSEAAPAWLTWIATPDVMKSHRVAAVNIRRVLAATVDGVDCKDMPLSDFTPGWADKFRAAQAKTKTKKKRPPSPTYVQRILTSLYSLLSWHVTQKTIEENPLTGFTRIDEEPYARQTWLTPEQVDRFLEHAHPLYQDIFRTAYHAMGLRPTEARELRREEVDLERMVITLGAQRTKMKRGRVAAFDSVAKEIIERRMRESRGPFVFVAPSDPMRTEPVSYSTMRDWMAQARERSGLKGINGEEVVNHTARHSAVTQLLLDGAQPIDVGRGAGMTDKTLRRYSKYDKPQQDRLREIMDGRRAPARQSPVSKPARQSRRHKSPM